ncbi:MAG: HPr(Ser) kinase/phosphatase [Sulfuricaulis sp.]|uniref:HPr(Ser) kinase/phosphatase n=1 Tax=Sulfuricaulis sp. TaxID=2003553 RepID=UPI0025CCD248|nr:HPr(Ser) kinase/phosphatase [Sulfuricaulis sp.]MCR4347047.1 HPr(Ser) kinase/phosphatase [Sulfuricaulis sp.]
MRRKPRKRINRASPELKSGPIADPKTTPAVTAHDLFEAESGPLKLKWVAGETGKGRLLEPTTAKFPGMALVGHLNFVHPNRIQVIGEAEIAYLDRLGKAEREAAEHNLFSCEKTSIVIVAGGKKIASDLITAANEASLALFSSALPSPVVIDHLQYYLTRALAPRVTVHGVYMEVMGMGVLITGESGIGKSELALELLSRDHRLIADDAVEFVRVGPDVIVGQCPTLLSDYLEVRGLGILDIRLMFGETAVRHKKKLHLIVRLESMQRMKLSKIDRLQSKQQTRRILDVEVPEVTLFVGPGRNLAVLVEAATRAYILHMWGFDPLEEFMKRHHEHMNNHGASHPAAPAGDKLRKARNKVD